MSASHHPSKVPPGWPTCTAKGSAVTPHVLSMVGVGVDWVVLVVLATQLELRNHPVHVLFMDGKPVPVEMPVPVTFIKGGRVVVAFAVTFKKGGRVLVALIKLVAFSHLPVVVELSAGELVMFIDMDEVVAELLRKGADVVFRAKEVVFVGKVVTDAELLENGAAVVLTARMVELTGREVTVAELLKNGAEVVFRAFVVALVGKAVVEALWKVLVIVALVE